MIKPKSKDSIKGTDLIEYLERLPETGKYWIAFSGGMDSSVLLHLFYSIKNSLKNPIEVIHINHGLNSNAKEWAEFCKNQSKEYDFTYHEIVIDEQCNKGESIEAWARNKRYELINQHINEQDIIFTAHHRDDQVETFFLQALRGSGPRGLVSMPDLKQTKKRYHARPLLNITRSSLLEYAKSNKLDWCEDQSNEDQRFDRNYLRHSVLPNVESRWPAYRDTINRSLKLQQDYKILIDEIAAADLDSTSDTEKKLLKLSEVKKLSTTRQKNLIYYWLKNLEIELPAAVNMEKILHDLINTNSDKSPCVNWNNNEIRRYRDFLYAGKKMEDVDVSSVTSWDLSKPINILDETLSAQLVKGKGISEEFMRNTNLDIRYRQGGEKITPVNHEHSKSIKKLFQEKGVLPWYRDRVPLIYIHENLAAIPGFCIDKKYIAGNDESGWEITWSGYEKVIQR